MKNFKFLVLSMLCIVAGTHVELFAKSKKVSPAPTTLPQTITNTTGDLGTGNAMQVSFFAADKTLINDPLGLAANPVTLWFGDKNNGEYTYIPTNTAFITASYNNGEDIVAPLNFVAIDPKKSYSITFINNVFGLSQSARNTSNLLAPKR